MPGRSAKLAAMLSASAAGTSTAAAPNLLTSCPPGTPANAETSKPCERKLSMTWSKLWRRDFLGITDSLTAKIRKGLRLFKSRTSGATPAIGQGLGDAYGKIREPSLQVNLPGLPFRHITDHPRFVPRFSPIASDL